MLAAKRYRGGMTVCGGMTVKQFVIPQRDLLLADEIPRMNRGMTFCCLLAAKRYRGGMTVCGGMTVKYPSA
ncbi:hypothetical protein [Wolbachia endosymbiont of Aedes albopictus]|uniref:hypothetical protein n=1 Tax=Wolbachia endosymbiont of Aedes albopictus TaxID=167957 RepID=UPI0021692FDA|nr:hypothetical protein [Wolbachia endosymbiont of Aedes albopictus]UVW83920.1 hypothetical protein NHG98_00060 [Wolbachia endosymbiont of Aedes albopictus]